MGLDAPQPLLAAHRLDAFDCGNPALNIWLAHHAQQAQANCSARTFVVAEAGLVLGYFSLSVGQVDTLSAPQPSCQGQEPDPVPLVILARLAVTLARQHQGIGRGLLQDAIRRSLILSGPTGIRALLTHPIDDQTAGFYRRFGFISSPWRENHLLLRLPDAQLLLGRPQRTSG